MAPRIDFDITISIKNIKEEVVLFRRDYKNILLSDNKKMFNLTLSYQ